MRYLWLLLILLLSPCVLAQDEEDDDWRKRLPTGPMQVAPGPLGQAGLPTDPNPTRIYPQPTVFQNATVYVWFTTTTVSAADHPGGPLQPRRSGSQWQFFPNGRFLYEAITYKEGGSNPEKAQLWGRYNLGSDGNVTYETDGGESDKMRLAYGRRNLYWMEMTYSEVHWEQEVMRRQLNP